MMKLGRVVRGSGPARSRESARPDDHGGVRGAEERQQRPGCTWPAAPAAASWPPATWSTRSAGASPARVSAVLGDRRAAAGRRAELRLDDTPLYNSIYRFDDEMLVNVHAYGILAAYTPVMHLRRVDGAFFNTYVESFERVWASARVPSVSRAGAS